MQAGKPANTLARKQVNMFARKPAKVLTAIDKECY